MCGGVGGGVWGVCQLYSITYFLRQGIKSPLALPLVGTFIPIMLSVSMIIYAAHVWVCGWGCVGCVSALFYYIFSETGD